MAHQIISDAQAKLPPLVMLPYDEKLFVASIGKDALREEYISARATSIKAYQLMQRSFKPEDFSSKHTAFKKSLQELRKEIVGRCGLAPDYVFA